MLLGVTVSGFTGFRFHYTFSGICWSRVCQWIIYLYSFWYSNISKYHLCIRCGANLSALTVRARDVCVHSGPTFTLYKLDSVCMCQFWDRVHDANVCIGSTEPGAIVWNCWCHNLQVVYHTAWNSNPAGWLLISLQTCNYTNMQKFQLPSISPYPEKYTLFRVIHIYHFMSL